LDSGDGVDVRSNPLSSASRNTHIPALQARGVVANFDPPQEVNIPDVNLESALRAALNKPIGVLTDVDLASLTSLNANGRNISNLTGLEYCTNLTMLVLYDNQITDISPLQHLTSLRTLDLDNNQISYLRPLEQNSGLDAGDYVSVKGNPLNSNSLNMHIPTLQARGVTVKFDAPPDKPLITVVPASVDFGNVIVGMTVALIVSVGNNGSAALSVTDITSDLGEILAMSETMFTSAPGAEAYEITLTLTALTVGAINGTLTITSNDPNSPTELNISAFAYLPPNVTAISPTGGAIAGGTSVNIIGVNFVDGTTVTIGGSPATDVVFLSEREITATTPVGSVGFADVVVTNPDGQSGTLTGGFTYLQPVTVALPEVPGRPGDTISIPVVVDDAMGIAGGELTVLYDASLLRVVDVKLTDLTKGFLSLVSNLDVPGRATVSLVNATGSETESGRLVELVAEIDKAVSFNTEIPLTLDTANLWTESAVAFPTVLKSGKVVILDSVPPTASITINDGAKYTNSRTVVLTLSASDTESGMGAGAQMFFSNDNVTWSTPTPYAKIKEWTLPQGDGDKTVYLQCQDVAGNWMPEATKASVVLDETQPTGTLAIAGGAAWTNQRNVSLTISAADETSGVTQMRFFKNETWSEPEPYAQTKNWTLSSSDGSKTVDVQCQDAAGNWSAVVSATIGLDITLPTGTLTISDAAAWTNQRNVVLTISANDKTSGVARMSFKNENETWSQPEPYAQTKNWTLPSGDGSKTVYVQYEDAAGNLSSPAQAEIGLDTTLPTGTLTISGGDELVNQRAVTLTLTATDATSGMGAGAMMCFSNDGENWSQFEPYSTTKPWELASGDGVKNLYAQFQDVAGNLSPNIKQTIALDTTPPAVVQTTPKKEKMHAPINAAITIAFDENINSDFVNSENIKVVGEKSGDITGKFTIDWSLVSFIPDKIFADREKVTVTISTGVQDVVGNALENQFTFSFTTGISVRSGDANNDGKVNIRDVAPLGRYWGKTGEARQEAKITWDIHPAVPWEFEAATYADTNGDGIVNARDIIPIGENWQLAWKPDLSRASMPAAPIVKDSEISIEGMITLQRYYEMLEVLEGVPVVTEGVRDLKVALKTLISQQWALLIPETKLLQNYPNPFNPDTWIPYQLAQDSEVTISIYNQRGQLVRLIALGIKPAGVYFTKDKAFYWDGKNNQREKVASGVYFYQLKAGDFDVVRKMFIVN